MQLVPHPRAKSSIWTHFGFKAKSDGNIVDWKKVVCCACNQQLAHSGNTSNLTYHLSKLHPNIMAEINKEKKRGENGADKSVTERSRKTIKHFMVANPLQHSSTCHKELVDAITDFLCMDMQPISAVEGNGFQKLMYTAEPRFQVPSISHFSRKQISMKYNQQAEQLKSQLVHATSFNITTDIWSSHHPWA